MRTIRDYMHTIEGIVVLNRHHCMRLQGHQSWISSDVHHDHFEHFQLRSNDLLLIKVLIYTGHLLVKSL